MGEVSPTGQVLVKGPCELVVSVRYQGRPGRQPADLPRRSPGLRLAWAGGDQPGRHPCVREAQDAEDPSRAARDRSRLPSAGLLSTRSAACPPPEETRAFLADRDPAKRSRLIDRLLDRPEFADFWALKWADLLRNEEKTMGEKGVWVFQRWLRDQIAAEFPLDEMVRRIVTARGSTWTNPPSSFHRTNRDPMTAAETVAQVFLGIRLQCARCHNHPFDDWTQDDYYGLAAYFTPVARKDINNVRRDNFDKHEINGDEVIYLSGRPGIVQPRTRAAPRPQAAARQPLPGRGRREGTRSACRLADPRQSASSPGTWRIAPGST